MSCASKGGYCTERVTRTLLTRCTASLCTADPLRTRVSCADRYLAGPGSQRVAGASLGGAIDAESTLGHNKRVGMLPQGFAWAPSPGTDWAGKALPACVNHWSAWHATAAYGRPDPGSTGLSCAYTCTQDGLAQLASTTGTYDRWAEEVVSNSYGLLSLAPDMTILPVLLMPQTTGQSAFAYSEAPIPDHLRRLGYDGGGADFHTLLVRGQIDRVLCSMLASACLARHAPTALSGLHTFCRFCHPYHVLSTRAPRPGLMVLALPCYL